MPGLKIGIDLGTSTVRACVEGKGVVLCEPSALAVESSTGRVAAIGRSAYDMAGRNPDVFKVVRPLASGGIADYDMAEKLLTAIINRLCSNRVFKPVIAASMPSGITGLEKRTLLDVFIRAGAGQVCLIEEPLAAAIGAGIMLDRPFGTLVADIGGGTVDVAVITMGSIAVSESARVGGESLDSDIADYLRINRDIVIGDSTAQELKLALACAVKRTEEIAAVCAGKSSLDGMPFYFEVSSTEVGYAVRDRIEEMYRAVGSVLEITPPELMRDISENGIILTGGAAQLNGLESYIAQRTSINTVLAADPQNAAVKGLCRVLDEQDYLQNNGYRFMSYADLAG